MRRQIECLIGIDPSVFAEKIQGSGFFCIRCGWCCRENFMIRITPEILRPSNAISIFPDDIWRIIRNTKLDWDDVAQPDIYSCLSQGNAYLVIGWILRRKETKECVFYHKGTCSIYRWRPLICRCYPFFLKEQDVEIMHCNRLNGKMTKEKTMDYGKLLKKYEMKKLKSYSKIIIQLGEMLKSANFCMLPENFSGKVLVFDGESVCTCDI